MRKTIVAGNWKMNMDANESEDFIKEIVASMPALPENCSVIICPPYTSLSVAADLLKNSVLGLGGQNMSEHDGGAYTGEISWKMLQSVGCEYVILGHSERRQYSGETDALINLKVKKALKAGLVPIICVGETLSQREEGRTMETVSTQVNGVLDGLTPTEVSRGVIAYEPVWAIGTGKNATPEQAQEVHGRIRALLSEKSGEVVGESISILYGGSVKPDNVAELISQSDIDGSLVGGACIKLDSFLSIVNSSMKQGG
jgi:triosephosphate isomerase